MNTQTDPSHSDACETAKHSAAEQWAYLHLLSVVLDGPAATLASDEDADEGRLAA